MSVWYEVTDAEDLSFSDDFLELHVLFATDSWGNNYVSVSMEALVQFLASQQLVVHRLDDANRV